MDIQQLSVKIFAKSTTDGQRFDQSALIPIFHRWIREKRLGPEILLIDVADYRHVVDGPGIMIIGHHAHLGLDEGRGLGLRFLRRRDEPGEVAAKLRDGLRYATLCCEALSGEPTLGGALQFDGGALELRVQSRLHAPQSAATYASFEPTLRAFLAEVYETEADAIECEHLSDEREPFGVRVRVPGTHEPSALHPRLLG
ncbi:hypothetical protein [Haliangium ochraceum]|uniref:Uncharacterized protein n=1 Tax=Haliangium ochraceum (strain DSM 14365 / JCM 11303 / SMP-2) TaxID=502025 RepID=D0LWF8_HALO1|nr:hypothetical protein [Haliangium ochraceum]ACY17608.1 hypothetical protein Hoch_5120 [Haliangium ochraceum DSM 14365]